tara:strand:+ start:29 stop:253 length:225 start_codon:yes stop_codon:yes gene_type:complete
MNFFPLSTIWMTDPTRKVFIFHLPYVIKSDVLDKHGFALNEPAHRHDPLFDLDDKTDGILGPVNRNQIANTKPR